MKWSYQWTKDWHGAYHAVDPAVKENDGSAFTLCGKIITHPGTLLPRPDDPSKVICHECTRQSHA